MRDPAYVSNIIHKAVIEVNERETRGAAATIVRFTPACDIQGLVKVDLRLDRPFCFWILSPRNMVSFVGICADPREGSVSCD